MSGDLARLDEHDDDQPEQRIGWRQYEDGSWCAVDADGWPGESFTLAELEAREDAAIEQHTVIDVAATTVVVTEVDR
jgi:hypothetical protein